MSPCLISSSGEWAAKTNSESVALSTVVAGGFVTTKAEPASRAFSGALNSAAEGGLASTTPRPACCALWSAPEAATRNGGVDWALAYPVAVLEPTELLAPLLSSDEYASSSLSDCRARRCIAADVGSPVADAPRNRCRDLCRRRPSGKMPRLAHSIRNTSENFLPTIARGAFMM